MCGICGSLSLASHPVESSDVQAMMRALVHRGPDAGGMFVRPGIAAGIRRLAVIDVAGGDQPIANEDGTVEVVYNGEIYNYVELRDELTGRGHRFRTRSDTEVLVHLWEEHGPQMLERLNGMFAFCLHDSRKRETFIARDRLGIKPLFYFLEGDRLVFASELVALLAHRAVARDVDMPALVELFCLQYLSGDRTVYRGIHKLLPGHAIRVRHGTAEVERYYSIPRGAPATADGLDRRRQELQALLDSAVRYQLVSDVPLGVFLSGGLDSGIVAALSTPQRAAPLQTFSVGFEGPAAFDERRFARKVAQHCGAEHHELLISPVQIAEHLPRLIAHLGEPVMDPAMIPTYLLAEHARRRVTVVLTGEGADELFGGYRRYYYQSRYGWVGRVPGLRQLGRVVPRRAAQALGALAELDPTRNHLRWSATANGGELSRLFEDRYLRQCADGTLARFRGYFNGGRIVLGDQLRADQHEWLPHNLLAKVDRATMACSLEARVPFLDHRIVEWAAALPEELKIRGGTTKFILREAFRDRLPAEIVERGKQGFDLPLDSWLRGPLRPLTTDLLTRQKLARWEGLNPDCVLGMLKLHLGGKQDLGLVLFNILSVMIFLEGRV